MALPGPSNAVPFVVWYGFLVRTLIWTTNKVPHWRVQVSPDFLAKYGVMQDYEPGPPKTLNWGSMAPNSGS